MPINIKGGKNAKKGKNSGLRVERPLILVDNSGSQFYAVIESFGGNTANVKYSCPVKSNPAQTETVTAIGFIRSSLRKWCKRFNRGDVVVICKREFEDKKVDIIHKYNDDEIRTIKRIPVEYSKFQHLVEAYALKMDKAKNNTAVGDMENGDGIEFDENYSDEESDESSEETEQQQVMEEMNAEYAASRSGSYNSMSNKQRVDNPKYSKSNINYDAKKNSGGRPIAAQPSREMPPSDDSEDES